MNFKLSAAFTSFLFLITFAFQIYSQKCAVESGYQGGTYFDKKTKASLVTRKQKEIPAAVLLKINEQLAARVGRDFASKLKFDWGMAIDFDDETELRNVGDIKRIDVYDLTYKFSDGNKGLKNFYFSVVSDKDGNLIKELQLPDIASHSQKGVFIACVQALKLANDNGFPRERASARFEYDDETESFVWIISDSLAVEPDDDKTLFPIIGQGTYRQIKINANSGIVLKIYKETIFL